VGPLIFAPGGESLIFASEDGRIRSWHFVKKPEPIVQLAGHKKEVWGLAFTPDGTTLISSADDHLIKLWDTRDGKLRRALGGCRDIWTRRRSVKGSDTAIWGLAFSPDGRTLAAACGDAKVRLWDPITGRMTLVLDGHSQRVNAVAFAPDGRALASASHDGAIRFWCAERP